MKRPVRFFNTTGPCNPDDHYMLPPAERLIGAQLHRYIRDRLYWMLHAPRQTGKTTFLQSWMRELNAGGAVTACYVTVEACQGIEEREKAIPVACACIRQWAQWEGLPAPKRSAEDAGTQLSATLSDWAALVAPKPLVVLFDEVDVLSGDAIISFLRQLRGGFAGRGVGKFPVSIALVGLRDLKDYITAAKGGVAPNSGSPFNIKQDSAVIGNFTQENIARLFALRTDETGQRIAPEALDYVWTQSGGQPWIVNSLLMRATMRVLDEEDYSPVRLEHVERAREMMIEARETHLDSLGRRLDDPRVKRVVQAIITGDSEPLGRNDEDVRLTLDLGLVTWSPEADALSIANPIYAEILTRYLNSRYHDTTPGPKEFHWQRPDGGLDMDLLLREFQDFWRENSEIWEQTASYTEAFPHLLIMAFLQRLTNGGGRIEREYAAGSKRLDLAVEYRGEWSILEVKLLREGRRPEKVEADGLRQIVQYRDRFASRRHLAGGAPPPCYLVIFDRRPEGKKLPWDERLSWRADAGDGVTIVGC